MTPDEIHGETVTAADGATAAPGGYEEACALNTAEVVSLIAAAPALLAACRMVLDYFENDHLNPLDDEDEEGSMISTLRAAIEKAEG